MINLELDINEVNFILEVLTQQPYRNVAGIVQKVQAQAIAQMPAQPIQVPAVTEEAA
jgi:hypothetical protein